MAPRAGLCYTWADLWALLDPWPDECSKSGVEQGRGDAVQIPWTPESLWRMFETTGSIWAYLLYRQLAKRRQQWVMPILN